MRFGFVGPTYSSESLKADAQRAINLYPEPVESGAGKNRWALYGTPGLELFTTLPTSPVRGMWAGENRMFVVAGDTLYEVSAGGSYVAKGTVGNDGYPADIIANGNQLMVVSAGRVYVDNGAGAVAVNFTGGTDPVLGVRGAFLDGYGIVQEAFNSSKLYFSGLQDFTSWDPLDFVTKEAHPDHVAAILADHEELWVFGGQSSTEVFRNTGTDAVFERDPGAVIHYGCGAWWSPCRLSGGIAWLAMDVTRGGPFAVMARGLNPQRISNFAIESVWSSYPRYNDAIGYSYIEDGHHFWVLSFPTANATWVYDASTEMWHERGSWTGSTFTRQKGAYHCYVGLGSHYPKHYVGSYSTGNIYTYANDLYTEAGSPIRRVRTAPHVADENVRMFHSALTLDMETGDTPVNVSLDWSDDGGQTFNTPRTKTVTGAKARCKWNRLGSSRDRVYRVSWQDSVKAAVVDAYLDVTKGNG